jgi:hypothetical protein
MFLKVFREGLCFGILTQFYISTRPKLIITKDNGIQFHTAMFHNHILRRILHFLHTSTIRPLVLASIHGDSVPRALDTSCYYDMGLVAGDW